jgi:hypothetical protein
VTRRPRAGTGGGDGDAVRKTGFVIGPDPNGRGVTSLADFRPRGAPALMGALRRRRAAGPAGRDASESNGRGDLRFSLLPSSKCRGIDSSRLRPIVGGFSLVLRLSFFVTGGAPRDRRRNHRSPPLSPRLRLRKKSPRDKRRVVVVFSFAPSTAAGGQLALPPLVPLVPGRGWVLSPATFFFLRTLCLSLLPRVRTVGFLARQAAC